MTALAERVRALANEVHDPCSMAQGLPIGIVDMGLLLGVQLAEAAEGGVDVRLDLRVTAPGCMYTPYFERELRARVGALPEVRSLRLEWQPDLDWTPADIAPAAREKLRRRRERMLALTPSAAMKSDLAKR